MHVCMSVTFCCVCQSTGKLSSHEGRQEIAKEEMKDGLDKMKGLYDGEGAHGAGEK